MSLESALSLLVLLTSLAAPHEPPPRSHVVSDHGDTPLLASLGRQDANISDLHVFVRGGNLVLAVATNPAIPPGLSQYAFPSDLVLEINVDNDCEVRFDDPAAVAQFGGTIVKPKKIQEDVVFRIRFPSSGPELQVSGIPGNLKSQIQLFAGLRDDPFIRGPRIGRNVAAVVLKMPLALVLDDQPTILVWATAKVPTIQGACVDLAGRSLRSMFPENDPLNFLKPKHHHQVATPADVVIYDTSRPAQFPNGRELADDVVDLVGDPRVLSNDAPFPTANDVPFLATFPYLAPPHP